VICNDINKEALRKAMLKHKELGLKNIDYKVFDMPYENFFDIICFKSVLGGASRNNNEKKFLFFKQIYKALKPSGYLIFVENLEGCIFHKFFRRKFTKWGTTWNYLKLKEINKLINY